MPRRRLSLALLLPPPLSGEVNGLRRALGDTALDRVPPHITLVPPVNVREDDLDEGLATIRSAAAGTEPFALTIGPLRTFAPVNPVVYLAVRSASVTATGAQALPAELASLRDSVFRPPFSRELTHGFVPHVTVSEQADEESIEATVAALAGFRATTEVDRLHVMEEIRRDGVRVWEPAADIRFGPDPVVGRGGLEMELSVTTLLPPDAQRLQDREWPGEALAQPAEGELGLVVVARGDGQVIGLVAGATHGPMARLYRVVVSPGTRQQGVAGHLLGEFEYAAGLRGGHWLVGDLIDLAPLASLLERRGWVRGGAVAGSGPPLVEFRRVI